MYVLYCKLRSVYCKVSAYIGCKPVGIA